VQKDEFHCPRNLAGGGLTSNDPGQRMCIAFEERSTSSTSLGLAKVLFSDVPVKR
jgi:hypothetical protein